MAGSCTWPDPGQPLVAEREYCDRVVFRVGHQGELAIGTHGYAAGARSGMRGLNDPGIGGHGEINHLDKIIWH